MTEFSPFPVDCLPRQVRHFVVDQARSIGCDESVVALPALSVLASTIGPTRRIRLKRTWSEPAILWTAVIADSGVGSSPALSATLEPLRESEDAAASQLLNDAWRAGRSDRFAVEGQSPAEVETAARYLVGDINTDHMLDMLVNHCRGLLMSQDQLDGWMSLFDRKSARGRSEQARWFQFHSGNPLSIDRRKKPVISLQSPSVSVTGCVEPRHLADRYKRNGMSDGLFGRLLFAYPPTKPLQWADAEIDEEVFNDFDALIYNLQASWTKADGQQYVEMTPEAKTLLINYANELGEDFNDEPSALRSVGSRLASHAARLALVLHLTHCAASLTRSASEGPSTLTRSASEESSTRTRSASEESSTLTRSASEESARSASEASGKKIDWTKCDATSMQNGITLARWFANEARRVHELMPANQPPKEARQQLLEWLSHRSKITPRDLCRDNRRYPTTNAARIALQELVQLGHGTWITEPAGEKGGRPARIFVLNGWGKRE